MLTGTVSHEQNRISDLRKHTFYGTKQKTMKHIIVWMQISSKKLYKAQKGEERTLRLEELLFYQDILFKICARTRMKWERQAMWIFEGSAFWPEEEPGYFLQPKEVVRPGLCWPDSKVNRKAKGIRAKKNKTRNDKNWGQWGGCSQMTKGLIRALNFMMIKMESLWRCLFVFLNEW